MCFQALQLSVMQQPQHRIVNGASVAYSSQSRPQNLYIFIPANYPASHFLEQSAVITSGIVRRWGQTTSASTPWAPCWWRWPSAPPSTSCARSSSWATWCSSPRGRMRPFAVWCALTSPERLRRDVDRVEASHE